MTATVHTPAPARSRAGLVALRTAQVLIALFLIGASGLPKFAGQADAVQSFEDIGWGQWFRYVTGAVEVSGAVLLLIPRTAGLAAAALVGLMVGAVVAHLLVLEPAFGLFPAALGVILGVIAWHDRDRTRALLTSLTRRS